MSQAGSVQEENPQSKLKNDTHLAWVDMEMTGLNPDTDKVIEIAIVITDSELEVIAEGPVIAIHQSDEVLAGMDEWNTRTHGRSGLTERVRQSSVNEDLAQKQLVAWLSEYIGPNKTPMCGNSICQDRRFMAKHMPELEAYFHYRNLDVSSFKEVARRWNPAMAKGFVKKTKHTALSDIMESIEELRYYRQHFIVPPENAEKQ
jgi:oligoribonuclease